MKPDTTTPETADSDAIKRRSSATCSLTFYPVGEGYEVATWPGPDAQERAESAFRGWKHLGSKPCVSVRKANV